MPINIRPNKVTQTKLIIKYMKLMSNLLTALSLSNKYVRNMYCFEMYRYG